MIESENVLKKRAEQIQEELQKEKEKGAKLREAQESEISKMRDKLRQLQNENASTDGEKELLNRIQKEEQEQQKIADEQRKLEVRMALHIKSSNSFL